MRRAIFFKAFSGRAVDREPNRALGHFSVTVAGCLLLTACRTVGLPAPPITITTDAVPVVEAPEVEVTEIVEARTDSDSSGPGGEPPDIGRGDRSTGSGPPSRSLSQQRRITAVLVAAALIGGVAAFIGLNNS